MIDAPPLTGEIAVTLAIGLAALGLFVWNRIRIDVVSLLVMVAVILTGVVSPQEGISGFANEATITVAAMFVLSAGLVRTGGVEVLGRWMKRMAGESEFRLLAVSLAIVIPVSAFINNTPVVVVMIPLIMGLTRDTGIAPSRIFLPISYASQMGGSMTLIGTSTNLLVAGLVLELGMDRIGLFDITAPAFLMMLAGVAYLLTIGRWLTPVRETDQGIEDRYELGDYLSGLEVTADSDLVGRTLRDTAFGEAFGLLIVTIEREGERVEPRGGTEIHAGDVLVVQGKMSDITQAQKAEGLLIAGARPRILEEGEGVEEVPLHLAELMVPLRSPVVGRSIRGLSFRGRYGLPVIGIRRHGAPLHEPMRSVRLEAGDILLVQGTSEDLRRIHSGGELALLGSVDLPVKRPGKLRYALPIIAGVVLLAAFNIAPILVSALMGATAMFLVGCLTPEEAYQDVDWMVLVLLGGMIPLGIAMQETGTASFLVSHSVGFVEPLGLLGALAGLYLVTGLLTEVISNNASAVVLTPIAVALGLALDASPLPFVIAVMFAASNSYMTPIGYQTNAFIFGPGGYRFSDYIRVGAPLNLIMLVVATLVIPIFFPF
jgi:di/tricarboxylate transporter